MCITCLILDKQLKLTINIFWWFQLITEDLYEIGWGYKYMHINITWPKQQSHNGVLYILHNWQVDIKSFFCQIWHWNHISACHSEPSCSIWTKFRTHAEQRSTFYAKILFLFVWIWQVWFVRKLAQRSDLTLETSLYIFF